MNRAEFFLHLVCSVLILSSLVAFSFDQVWVGIGIVINVVAIEMTIFKMKCWHQCRNGRAHYLPRNPEQAIAARVVAADGRSWLIHPPLSADEGSAIHPPLSADEGSAIHPPLSADEGSAIHPPLSAGESRLIRPPVLVDERSRLIHPPVSVEGTDIPGKTTVSYGIGETWQTPRGSYFTVFQSFGSVREINETASITPDLRLSSDCESQMFSFDSQFDSDSVEEQFMQSMESEYGEYKTEMESDRTMDDNHH